MVGQPALKDRFMTAMNGTILTLTPSSLRGLAVATALVVACPLTAQPPTFQHVVIDATNPSDPHCKALGDIDGDGLLDALAASSSGGGLFWY